MEGEGAAVPPGRPYEGITMNKPPLTPRKNRRRLSCAITALAALASSAAIASAAPTPSFMGLGTTSTCRFPTVAFGVSADGSTVVGRCQNNTGNGQFIAFRWTEDTGLETLGDLPGGELTSAAVAVSADGSIVVGGSSSTLGTQSEAFRWTAQTGLVPLGDLPGGSYFSAATDVSADGSVVVGFSTSDLPNSEAFRWTAQDGMVGLGAARSSARAVSTDGSVIVGDIGSLVRPFRWTAQSGLVNLGLPSGGAIQATAQDVSSDGNMIVGAGIKPSGDAYAYVWREGSGFQNLETLSGDTISVAREVSADGNRIVGYSRRADFRAVLWDGAYGSRDLRQWLVNDFGLDLTGWLLTDAYAISSDGNTIVGVGINPQGEDEAFRAVIPEPATALLALAAIAILCPYRRSHQSRL